MMSRDGGPHYEESFNSFLAGMLLTKNRISNFAFFERLNYFQNVYSVDIISRGDDIRLPYIYLDDNEIKLLKSLDEDFLIDNKRINIRNYLYSFTTPRVREFFGIPEIKKEDKKVNPLVKRLFKNSNVKKKAVI